MSESNPIIERWKTLTRTIEALKPASGPPVTLIAVSKTQPVEAIIPLLEAGHRAFGENRVQEAMEKWPPLRGRYPDIELHLIGPLQTNKVKEALSLFDVIHTIDRIALVDVIVKERNKGRGTRTKEFFIQVNIAREPQKAGVASEELAELVSYNRERLPVTGLMCVPPAHDAPAPYFASLAAMAQEYKLPHLSMGMSGDYETAITLGATHVRIGTALFGERKT